MAQFLLMLYDNPADWHKLSPDEMQKALEKYMAWGKKPFYKQGIRLAEDAGKVLRGKARATDGPYSETKEVLGGFYAIEAASYQEAVDIAATHPHLEYGGTIEVRKSWSA
jgi:hypothetical protein